MRAAGELHRLVASWVEGWALCRSSSWRPLDGPEIGWEVDLVGSRHRDHEIVLLEPSDATFTGWAERVVGVERSWVTVITATPRELALPPGLRVHAADETLMTVSLGPTARGSSTWGHPTVDLTIEPDRALAAVIIDNQRACEGTVAVAGSTAVFDRIRTYEDFRRRGLGTRVMAELTAWAIDRGATRGVLGASVEGQALYERLGWSNAASLVTVLWAP